MIYHWHVSNIFLSNVICFEIHQNYIGYQRVRHLPQGLGINIFDLKLPWSKTLTWKQNRQNINQTFIWNARYVTAICTTFWWYFRLWLYFALVYTQLPVDSRDLLYKLFRDEETHFHKLIGPWELRLQSLVIFKLVSRINILSISCDTALKWMPHELTNYLLTLVQVMAWCRQATSHYLNQCWLTYMTPHSVTRPQWITHVCIKKIKLCYRRDPKEV